MKRIAPKPNPSAVTINENTTQSLRTSFFVKGFISTKEVSREEIYLDFAQMDRDKVFKIKVKLDIFLRIMIESKITVTIFIVEITEVVEEKAILARIYLHTINTGMSRMEGTVIIK